MTTTSTDYSLPTSVRAAWSFVVDPLREANEQQRQWLLTPESRTLDRETTTVMIVSAVILTLQYYFVTTRNFVPVRWIASGDDANVAGNLIWCGGHVVLYLLVPVLVLVIFLRQRPTDFGLKLRGMFSYWWIYVGMYLVMLPIIFIAARRPSFQHMYPFYRAPAGEPLWPRMILWELGYALQFVSLEFFFRGFMLHGTKRRFGAYTILVMTIPYCMIHFQKLLPETLGAIIAGIVLGFMSLKTRSIWMGAALHIAIAWTMDALAIWNRS